MKLHLYTFEDRHGYEDTYTTSDYADAEAYARANAMRIIDNTYVWDEAETIADFTPDPDDDDE